MKRVASATAGGIPIAMPFFCLKVRSPKVKKLFLKMISSNSMAASIGMAGNLALLLFIKWERFWIAKLVGMFVYIDSASAVNSMTLWAGGSWRDWMCCLRAKEFLMKELRDWAKGVCYYTPCYSDRYERREQQPTTTKASTTTFLLLR